MKSFRFSKWNALLAGVLLLAVGWKVLLLAMDVLPFNADEAVVGLMARHILEGELPLFFYGQAYMGSLDALLVAGGFSLFGAQVWVIRLVQILLYLGTIYTTVLMGRKLGGKGGPDGERGLRAGLIAGLLLAIPTVNVTLYTTVSLGGYGEALLLGNLIVLLGLRLLDAALTWRNLPWLVLWAGLVGLGLWANGLTMIYSLPVGLMLVWRVVKERKQAGWRGVGLILLALLVGFFIGSLPWWLYAFQNGLDHLVRELSGSAVSVEPGDWGQRVLAHLQNLLLLGGTVIFGFRPPFEVRWLALPLLPFLLVFWAAVVFVALRATRKAHPAHPLFRAWTGVTLTLCGGFIFTSFGVDPSGRYFIPLAVPLALGAAEMVLGVAEKVRWQALLVGLVLVYQGWGTLDCALRYPPGITTQFDLSTVVDGRRLPELAEFLEENGETHGYTNYWIGYPLAFESDERLIFVPRLPYHQDLRYTARDDRYEKFGKKIGLSDKIAYITSNTPALDDLLRAEFTRLGVSWKEEKIGDYQVFYALSRVVHPAEMGLGETTSP